MGRSLYVDSSDGDLGMMYQVRMGDNDVIVEILSYVMDAPEDSADRDVHLVPTGVVSSVSAHGRLYVCEQRLEVDGSVGAEQESHLAHPFGSAGSENRDSLRVRANVGNPPAGK